MEAKKKKISVCIATYNGEKYIEEQLNSIRKQLHDNDEIIISDDGSTDKTLEIISSLNDSRIRILNHISPANHVYKNIYKVTKNFENALKEAKGDIIFLSDQDDIWSERKVKVMSEALEEKDLVISNFAIINEKGIVTQHPNCYIEKLEKKSFLTHFMYLPYFGCVMAMNKKFLDFALPFPNIYVHDRYLGLLAKKYNQLGIVKEELVYYRRYGTNTSSNTHNSLIDKVKSRLLLLLATFRGNYK